MIITIQCYIDCISKILSKNTHIPYVKKNLRGNISISIQNYFQKKEIKSKSESKFDLHFLTNHFSIDTPEIVIKGQNSYLQSFVEDDNLNSSILLGISSL